jgi:membrane protein
MLIDRISSPGIVLTLGFLLLVSLLLTTLISTFSDWIGQQLPGYFVSLFYIASELVSLGLITVLFAVIYRVLPDVNIPWKVVWIGALVTAILFTLGKFLLGFYFGKTDPGSAFGAAGSLILILLWVNYSGLIFFFGAEFIKVSARHKNVDITLSSHAQRTEANRYRQEQKANAGE